MEFETHKKFAEIALKKKYDISDYRKRKVAKQTNEPDLIKNEINPILTDLFQKYPTLHTLAKKFDCEILPDWHTHERTAVCITFLGKAAQHLNEKGDENNAYRLYSWAIHYLVDSGTPFHNENAISLINYLTKLHQQYENYIDNNIENFYPVMQAGFNSGLRNTKAYRQVSAISLINFAKQKYIHITGALNDEKELERHTKEILKRIGYDLGRFTRTYPIKPKKV